MAMRQSETMEGRRAADVLPARSIQFVERIESPAAHVDDLEAARIVVRFQGGDADAFGELYRRYFDRIYGYLRVALKDSHSAEDATQQVFMNLLEGLKGYERRGKPFEAWLFTVVRNYAIRQLRGDGRVDVVDPTEISEQRERDGLEAPAEMPALSWLTDTDLLVLIERLPSAQRQVLALRYMLGLQMNEIAEVLGHSPNHISVLHYRALGFLRQRLTALGRQPARRDSRARTRSVIRHARVLRRRRFALSP
jgi:RNA polymerase sigma-70 factor (ECF subfamily)